MAIHVDVLIDVHERELRKATSKLKREADKLGVDLSDRISKGFKNVSPQAVKALDAESDAMVRLRRQVVEYNRVAKDQNATDEQRLRALEDLSKAIRSARRDTDNFNKTNERELKLTRQRAQVIGANTKAFKDFRDELGKDRAEIDRLRTANAGLIKSNDGLARNFEKVTAASKKTTRAHDAYNRMVESGTATREQLIRQTNLVRDAYDNEREAIRNTTDSVAEETKIARQRGQVIAGNTKAFSDLTKEIDRHRAGVQLLRNDNATMIRDNASLRHSFDRVTDATTKSTREQQKYNQMVVEGGSSRDQLIRQSNAVRDSYEKERRAIHDATDAMKRHNGAIEDGDKKSFLGRFAPSADLKSAQRDIQGFIGSLVGVRLSGPLGAALIVGVGKAILDVAKVAVTATQSLWLMPAALSAAGAGFGTLKLATSGFGDAIGALAEGDLEKFALQLSKLSPSAQQAALSIQAIWPELDELRKATQEEFFKGIGGELERLNATYLPSIQAMTSSIAGSFNSMFTGISMELVEPQTQAQLQSLFDNISAAFQNLAPAARSLTQAFVDIAAAGGEFLPDMAAGAADLAAQFAAFIREARESGNLRRWIEEGISAVDALGDALWYVGQTIYELFGGDGKQNVEDFKAMVDDLRDVVYLLRGDFDQLKVSKDEAYKPPDDALLRWMDEFNFKTADWIADVPEFSSVFVREMTKAMSAVGQAIDQMVIKPLNTIQAFMENPLKASKDLASGNLPKPKFPIPEIPSWSIDPGWTGDGGLGQSPEPWGPGRRPPGAPGGPPAPPPSLPTLRPGEYRDRNGNRHRIPQPGAPAPGTNRPVPPAPPLGPDGKPLSDKDRLDAAMAGLDPSQWRVDPYAGVPGAPTGAVPAPPGSSPYTGPVTPPPGTSPFEVGYYESVDPQKSIEADRKVQSAAHDLEEDRKKRLALEMTGLGTAEEINDAKWKELEDQWRLQEAQADLVETQRGTWKKLYDVADEYNSLMEGIGAGLDADMGISKGLAGMADNFVRFLAAVATAPLMGQLALTSARAGGPERTGSGLMGILGQQGVFGPEYTPEGQLAAEIAANSPGSTSTSGPGYGYTTATTGGGGGAYSSDAALLANVPRGVGEYNNEVKDLSRGLVDCASGVEDLVNIMDGRSTVGGELWTGNASTVLPKLGFLPGMGGPGDFRIGYNSGHMEATLPGGTNVNYGSTEAIRQGGVSGGMGADDPAFTEHYYRPAGATGGPVVPGMPGMPGSVPRGSQTLNTPFGSIPIPLPVTIVGGTMDAPPGARPGAPPRNAAAAAIGGGGGGGTPGADWDAIAAKESGGNWQLSYGDADSTGGLQIQDRTWLDYGGGAIAPHAYLASKEDQIRIAEKILAEQGPKAWAGGKNFVPYTGPPAGAAGARPPAGGPPLPGLPPGPLSPADLVNPALTPPIPGFAGGGAVKRDDGWYNIYSPSHEADRQAQRETHSGAFTNRFGAVQPWQWGAEKGNFNPGMQIDTSTTGVGGHPWYDMAASKLGNLAETGLETFSGAGKSGISGMAGAGLVGLAARLYDRFHVPEYGGVDKTFAPPQTPFNASLYQNMVMGYGAGAANGPDTVPAMLQPGEHVLTTDDVQALGGQGAVYGLRNFLHMQGGGAVPLPGAPPPPPPPPPPPVRPPPAPAPARTPGVAGASAGLPVIPGLQGIAQQGFNTAAAATGRPQYGGVGSVSIPGGSAASGLGIAGDAAAAALSAFPGAGPAAAAAMALIGRASKYAGQVAGIGVQGLFETFLPAGGSELASNNWLTRIGGAFAGMAPQLPNVAGKAGEQGQPSVGQMLTPEQIAASGAPPAPSNPPPGPVSNTGVHIDSLVVDSAEKGMGLAREIARWNIPGQR